MASKRYQPAHHRIREAIWSHAADAHCRLHLPPWTAAQVALQFPDYLLPDSVAVMDRLRELLPAGSCQLFLLADTTYGRSARRRTRWDPLRPCLTLPMPS